MLVFLSRDGKIMFWSDSGLVRFISTFVTIMLMIKNGIFKKKRDFPLNFAIIAILCLGKANRTFSKNSSDLVAPPFPY